MTKAVTHQYIQRGSHRVVTETPIADRCIQFLYNGLRENAPAMFRAVTSGRMSALLGYLQYDMVGRTGQRGEQLFRKTGIDHKECLQPLSYFDSYRKVFERQIHYWQTRPMESSATAVVSPADARILIGSLEETSSLWIKEKFFDKDELLGPGGFWNERFDRGDFAVFRLTPDKYHYNHVPVSGRVVVIYEIEGGYHSCNPVALISVASLYSKNRRIVTLIDTDVEGGSQIGLVAMIEVVAMMIGDVVQAYSETAYDSPRDVCEGMFLLRGSPKSLYRPGSSTDILLFEPGRIRFAEDLVENSRRCDIQSRFTTGVGRPLVETDILVRSTVAYPYK
jgi:phosphatidylserine decarboxylase